MILTNRNHRQAMSQRLNLNLLKKLLLSVVKWLRLSVLPKFWLMRISKRSKLHKCERKWRQRNVNELLNLILKSKNFWIVFFCFCSFLYSSSRTSIHNSLSDNWNERYWERMMCNSRGQNNLAYYYTFPKFTEWAVPWSKFHSKFDSSFQFLRWNEFLNYIFRALSLHIQNWNKIFLVKLIVLIWIVSMKIHTLLNLFHSTISYLHILSCWLFYCVKYNYSHVYDCIIIMSVINSEEKKPLPCFIAVEYRFNLKNSYLLLLFHITTLISRIIFAWKMCIPSWISFFFSILTHLFI